MVRQYGMVWYTSLVLHGAISATSSVSVREHWFGEMRGNILNHTYKPVKSEAENYLLLPHK